MFKTRKVVIVGAGHVGSHVALALIQSGEADDIVLIDILKEKAIGQPFQHNYLFLYILLYMMADIFTSQLQNLLQLNMSTLHPIYLITQ